MLALLFLPQWQGSSVAEARGLINGAEGLRKLFPKRDFVRLEVQAERTSEMIAGVRSHTVLTQQLAAARHTLDEAEPDRLLTLGGDCSVDMAPVAYLNERHDDLAVLWLDAHPDINTPDTSPSGALHGMVLRHLLGEGDGELLARVQKPLEPRQVFLAGVRDFDPPEREYVDDRAVWQMGVAELETRPERLTENVKARGLSRLHLHFDFDVLDPAAFAATGYPTPGGLSLAGATQLLHLLEASFDIVGIAVTEYLPQVGGEHAELRTLVGNLPKL